MKDFNLYSVLIDVSIIAILLLVGQLLRAKVKIIQKLLIPPSLMAGAMGLILGPNVLDILPFSSQIGKYASILVIIIFAAMPIGDKPEKGAISGPAIGGMFFNLTGIGILQYGIGMIMVLYLFNGIMGYDLNPGFGLLMGGAFLGGPGTVAAVGSAFEKQGWPDATALGMTMVTFGIIGGILFGIVIINWAARKGYTNYVDDPNELPSEMRTGLIPVEKQKAEGLGTISSISMDPLAFHLGLVLLPSLLGYLLSKMISAKFPWLEIPVFCTALLFGFIEQIVLSKLKLDDYVDRYSINRISGTATDILIVSAISDLKISLIVTYAFPLFSTIVMAFVLNFLWFIYVGGYSSPKDWLERNMMVWGQANGVIATGILLLRIVDPNNKSRAVEDSGVSNLLNRPIITFLVVLPPILFGAFPSWMDHAFTWICMGGLLIFFIVAYKFKWWIPSGPLKKGKKAV